jgi:hypothetical protein
MVFSKSKVELALLSRLSLERKESYKLSCRKINLYKNQVDAKIHPKYSINAL